MPQRDAPATPQFARGRRLPFAFSALDPDVRREPVWLEATDTAQSFGILYRPPGGEPRTARPADRRLTLAARVMRQRGPDD